MRFKCANRISIFLRSRRDRLKALGAGERPGDVAGMLMNVARDLAKRFLRTALRSEFACHRSRAF